VFRRGKLIILSIYTKDIPLSIASIRITLALSTIYPSLYSSTVVSRYERVWGCRWKREILYTYQVELELSVL